MCDHRVRIIKQKLSCALQSSRTVPVIVCVERKAAGVQGHPCVSPASMSAVGGAVSATATCWMGECPTESTEDGYLLLIFYYNIEKWYRIKKKSLLLVKVMHLKCSFQILSDAWVYMWLLLLIECISAAHWYFPIHISLRDKKKKDIVKGIVHHHPITPPHVVQTPQALRNTIWEIFDEIRELN